MPNNLPNANPLSYLGVRPETPPNLIRAQRAPTSGDAEPVGTFWVDEVAGNIWSVSRYVSGSPDWELIGGNNGYPITPYVVGPAGKADYQTIQSAVNAANAAGGGAVYVQPGTYTENLTLYDGVQIVGATGYSDFGGTGAVVIIGTHTPPASGVFTISRVLLQSATNVFSSAVAGTAILQVNDCVINVTNGYLFNVPNWTGTLTMFDCDSSSGTNDGCINNTGGATVVCFEAGMGVGAGNPLIVTGSVTLQQCQISCPSSLRTGTSLTATNCIFIRTVTSANNSISNFINCSFSTGATASISHGSTGTMLLGNCVVTSSNNPAIAGAGAGVLTLANVVFTSDAHTAGTLTLGTGSTLKVGGGIESSTTMTAGTVLRASGDVAGVATTVSVSNVVDEVLGAGAGTVLMKTANPGNSSGWLKIYNGVDVRYVPYWTNISP